MQTERRTNLLSYAEVQLNLAKFTFAKVYIFFRINKFSTTFLSKQPHKSLHYNKISTPIFFGVKKIGVSFFQQKQDHYVIKKYIFMSFCLKTNHPNNKTRIPSSA